MVAVLRLTKPTLEAFIQQFPDVIIGDIEPTVFAGTDPQWREDLAAWVARFKNAMGRPPAFLDLDVEWWREPGESNELYHQVQAMKARGLVGQIGVIFSGTPQDRTDEAWVEDAERHIQLVEDRLHWHPDRASSSPGPPIPPTPCRRPRLTP